MPHKMQPCIIVRNFGRPIGASFQCTSVSDVFLDGLQWRQWYYSSATLIQCDVVSLGKLEKGKCRKAKRESHDRGQIPRHSLFITRRSTFLFHFKQRDFFAIFVESDAGVTRKSSLLQMRCGSGGANSAFFRNLGVAAKMFHHNKSLALFPTQCMLELHCRQYLTPLLHISKNPWPCFVPLQYVLQFPHMACIVDITG